MSSFLNRLRFSRKASLFQYLITFSLGILAALVVSNAKRIVVSFGDFSRTRLGALLLLLSLLLIFISLIWTIFVARSRRRLKRNDEVWLEITNAKILALIPSLLVGISEVPKPFFISIYPVTNDLYSLFIYNNRHRLRTFSQKYWVYPSGRGKHPVTGVSRIDAEYYCSWLSKITGHLYRLPTEYEWEKAACGVDGRKYPWGNEFDKEKCNTAESGIANTTPVDKYENGRSPYGCYDMVGNVSEWTSTTDEKSGLAVIRGSNYGTTKSYVVTDRTKRLQPDCFYRNTMEPDYMADFIGFRIVKEDKT